MSRSSAAVIDRLSEEYFEGLRCPNCRMPRLATGCECSKERYHQEAMLEAEAWLSRLAPTALGKKRGRPQAAELAFRSAYLRSSRRAGLTDRPANNGSAMTVLQDEKLGLMDRFDVVPKWHPPTSIRTPRADHEPI